MKLSIKKCLSTKTLKTNTDNHESERKRYNILSKIDLDLDVKKKNLKKSEQYEGTENRLSSYKREEKKLKNIRINSSFKNETNIDLIQKEIKLNHNIPILKKNFTHNYENNKLLTRKNSLIKIKDKSLNLKTLNVINSILVIISIVFSIIDSNLTNMTIQSYFQKFNQNHDIFSRDLIDKIFNEISIENKQIYFQILNLILIIFINCLLLIIYLKELEIKKDFWNDSRYTLFNSGMMKKIIIEMSVLSIINPPLIFQIFEFEIFGVIFIQTLNSFITFVSTCKIYVLIKNFSFFTKWMNEDNSPICNKYFGNPGLQFSIRATFKQIPIKIVLTSFLLTMFYLSFILYSFEILVLKKINEIEYELINQSIFVSLWLIFETVTTVGYGDYYPETFLSRFIAIFSALFGFVSIASLILILNDLLKFDDEEINSYILIKKSYLEEKTQFIAGDVIKNFLQMRIILLNKSTTSHNFLLKNKDYKIDYFLNKLNEGEVNIHNLNQIPQIFLRFYNKMSCFNSLNQSSIKFQSIYRVLKSFSPNLEIIIKMISQNIEENFLRFENHLSERLKICSKDLRELNLELENFNRRKSNIHKKQQIIADYIVKVNNNQNM